jgi:hypothetical protein
MDSLMHAAANTAEDFPHGVTGMAAAIGKNKFSLMHELAGHGTAKLGLVDALKMVKRSRDFRILTAACEECGGIFIPLPSAVSLKGSTFEDLSKFASEFADVVRVVTDEGKGDTINENQMARIEREWLEMVAAGQVLMAHLRAEHDALTERRPSA